MIEALTIYLDRDKLIEKFREFWADAEEQVSAEEQGLERIEDAPDTLGFLTGPREQWAETRDQLAALIQTQKARIECVRKHVQAAEKLARHEQAVLNYVLNSIEAHMLCGGLARIEGNLSSFSLRKQPDKLIVSNEAAIPEEYFKVEMVPSRTLDKKKLLADLEAGKELPGAYIERNRKGLVVR